MERLTITDSRLDSLIAERDIAWLFSEYAQAIDNASPDTIPTAEFFRPDAVLENVGKFRDVGISAIMERQRERLAEEEKGQHIVLGIRPQVDLERGEARVKSTFMYLIQGDTPVPRSSGYYEDHLVRDSTGRWWFKERKITVRFSKRIP